MQNRWSGIVRSGIVTALVISLAAVAGLAQTLVSAGSTWKYLDNGTNQGTAWRAPAFSDGSWASGPAQLGYGDGGEATLVSYGPDSANKYITTYFRHSFQVANPVTITSLTLNVVRDDGAVVYLNGTEVWRTNMPTGTVSSTTLASTAIGGADESTFFSTSVSSSLLVAGTNVLAVEIHQSGGTSSDVSFDLSLTGSSTASVIRGPYLQQGTPSSVVVRWRTDAATDSRVNFGAAPGSLASSVDNATVTTEHEVALTGLAPATTYYYSVGTTSGTLAGNDANHFFVTSPVTGSSTTARFWVLGDSGTADANATAVRNAYEAWTGSTHTNFVMMLGDNAYNSGTDSEYQTAVFNMYPAMLRKSVLWPTLGNHDTASSATPPPTLPYFAMFTLPTAGEAGGLASGTENYYSFDYGNIHFVCLDSMVSSRSVGSPMLTWLQADLASTTQKWIIVFFHHPPYTKGSHNSDTESNLIQMRTNALPILEAAGVDLILSGHSHSYERSYLIDGHYGLSTTFTSGMKIDGGNGRIGGTGAYEKPTYGPSPNEGAVYAVAGSSGKISGGLLNHPAMFISLNNLGSMVLDINGNQLDAAFIRENGVIADSFTIIKGSAPTPPPAAPTSLTATAVSTTSIQLGWSDNASDETGYRIERCTGSACSNFAEVATTGANATSYIDGGLAASTAYRYRVRGYNGNGNSGYSNEAGATTQTAPTLPAAPSGLVASGVSKTAINLAWVDNASNENGFRIERCSGTKCTNFVEIATVGAGVSAYSSTGLTANTSYRFRVRAFNAQGDSGYSNIATGKTLRR